MVNRYTGIVVTENLEVFGIPISMEMSTVAYAKMILHCLKYPQYMVRGVLLGRMSNNELADKTASSTVKVVDAIPAIHNSLLAPNIETLLIHLDAYCEDEQLKIVGLYYANRRFNDDSFDEVWGRVAVDKLKEPLVVQIENEKLSLNSTTSCLRAYAREDGKWRPTGCEVENREDTIAITSVAVQNKLYRELADFENHLVQPHLADFFNTDLNLKIETIA